MTPSIEAIDHIHLHVRDRAQAERWYADVLGFKRIPAYEFWAADGGPLTLADAGDRVHLALFERAPERNRATIALRVNATSFAQWLAHLRSVGRLEPVIEDHDLSVSLYFSDPDGNPFEITTYDHEAARAALRP